MHKPINVAILGASGYTGAELIRLLHMHPYIRVTALSGESQAGKSLGQVFPHLAHVPYPDLQKIEDISFEGVHLAFCCLPHGTTQAVIAALPDHIRVIDLSADFRLHDVEQYHQWYGQPHKAAELQKHAVYGLTEWKREAIKTARLIANPGCYPTASQLPLLPLLKHGIIRAGSIIIDAKSGITGAGRNLKTGNLFAEADGGIQAYGVASHRHAPEIEQGLTEIAGGEVKVSFTPHLMPMSRGILSTIYAELHDGKTAADARIALKNAYEKEAFISLIPEGEQPSTHAVRGTNRCHIALSPCRIPGRIILTSAIDNLVKGASGQAIQNMNVMFGFPEIIALEQTAFFP